MVTGEDSTVARPERDSAALAELQDDETDPNGLMRQDRDSHPPARPVLFVVKRAPRAAVDRDAVGYPDSGTGS